MPAAPSADGHWQEDPGAWRTTPRPRGWKTLRAQVLARDGHQCTWIDDGQRCTNDGTDADHISDPDDHRPENLRTLCGYHHRKRTALQARAARGELPNRARPKPQHPGLIADDAGNTGTAARAAASSAAAAGRTAMRDALQRAREQAKRGADDEPPF